MALECISFLGFLHKASKRQLIIQDECMIVAFDFKNDLNTCFSCVKFYTFAHVLHLNYVGIVAGAYVEDTCERARAVG